MMLNVETKNLDTIFRFLSSVITVNNASTGTKLIMLNERCIKMDMS